jgi:hypothetical protein
MKTLVPASYRTLPMVALSASLLISSAAVAATWNVSTLSALKTALSSARSGDEIVVAPGTYATTTDLYMSYPGVTLRGSTGNRDDVVLKGGGFNSTNYARIVLHVNADNCTVKDLTLGDCYWHALFFENSADYAIIRNVRIYNAGEQVVKGVQYNTGGLIEQCLMEYTDVRINDNIARPDDYLGGIDLHGAINWTIRDNLIRNIIGQNGDGDSGIFLWNVSSGCTVERNVIYGCNKGISYGNPYNGSGTWAMNGGIVRNNFIYAITSTNADLGMEMCYVKDVKVYNNTIWTDSGSFFRTFQFNDTTAIPNTNLQLAYNIIRGNFNDFTSGRYTSTGDIKGNVPQPNWFWDPASGNLHLTKYATAAIDHATLLADAPSDLDVQARPIGSTPDVGADEFAAGDLNGDGHVDVVDLLTMVYTFGKSVGEPGYDPVADLSGDGTVDVLDLLIFIETWGM